MFNQSHDFSATLASKHTQVSVVVDDLNKYLIIVVGNCIAIHGLMHSLNPAACRSKQN